MAIEMETKVYSWPDMSIVIRQYIVQDDQGRLGVAYHNPYRSPDVLFAHPADMPERAKEDGIIYLTNTAWHLKPDGTYTGFWCDYNRTGRVPDSDIRHLTVIQDLGWLMPDKWADEILAGSDQDGYWDYGAKLGKIGGNPPVKGQNANEMNIEQAVDYCSEVGQPISRRGIRYAVKNGLIPGARKSGRDWLMTYEGVNQYLDNRLKRK